MRGCDDLASHRGMTPCTWHIGRQINEVVPERPVQNPKMITHILSTLKWTVDKEGETRMKKCWNITNHRHASMRAFGYNQLMGFLPTLAGTTASMGSARVRWRGALPMCQVQGAPRRDARSHPRMHRPRSSGAVLQRQISGTPATDDHGDGPEGTSALENTGTAVLQGRVDPSWEIGIPLIQPNKTEEDPSPLQPSSSNSSVALLRHGTLAYGYRGVNGPSSRSGHVGSIKARHKAPPDAFSPSVAHHHPSHPSFIHSILDRKMANRRFLSQLMVGISGHGWSV